MRAANGLDFRMLQASSKPCHHV